MTSGVRDRGARRRAGRRAADPEPEAESKERRPSDQRRYVRRRWVAAGVLAAVLGTGYLVLFTPVAGVHEVEVTGLATMDAEEVRAAAAIEPGTPLARLDTEEVRDRVTRLPKVFAAEVTRSFPGTVRIAVTERTPVAVAGGGHLVDGTGLDYAVVARVPDGLPKLTVDNVRPDDPATRAAVAVLAAIPRQLRARVVEVTAKTPGDVRLSLSDGKVVKWGGAEDSGRKAAVLGALLSREGRTYDVTTPDFPTIS
ncbi:MAG TPA: FtsQ-type POTRA domain-containing protein [Actinophytocola sp.]|uniref:cell division protein FtsQ/DivIB n=1 Tax=Actinophytocola sp. TaxID=1872138 RepID=UPI002DBA4CA8|nr:FtsQ-type POTRA domain-containing protein [Actinophytocola sp.]HEU5471539.1 FtsQ-type POTRA domain-containing protein [Actinophytocola sp.]